MDALARYHGLDHVSHDGSEAAARALVARIEAKGASTETPKSAERTPEEILDRIQSDNYDRRIEEALCLVRELRHVAESRAFEMKNLEAERDALARRIEKAAYTIRSSDLFKLDGPKSYVARTLRILDGSDDA